MKDQVDSALAAFEQLANNEMAAVGVAPFLLVLAISAAAAAAIAWLYTRFFSPRSTGSEIHRAFPLLGVSITAIFVCIQFSLPLSLGLLGALSIVRFRTPIKEPEEIGFLMLVIASSLACATFNFGFLLVILVVALGALVLRASARPIFERSSDSGLLVVSLSADEYRARGRPLVETLGRSIAKGQLESIAHTDGRVVVSYRFRGLDPESVPALEELIAEAAEVETSLVFAGANTL